MNMVRIFSCPRGQAALEMALILPILLLLVFGTVDFGLIFLTRSQVEEASATGARLASLGTAGAAVESTVEADYPGLTVNLSYNPGDTVGAQVTVTASKPYVVLTPVIAAFLGTSRLTISGNTTMVVEQVPGS